MEEITLSEALKIAIEKQNQNKPEEAKQIYENILKTYPKNPDTLHLLGLTLHQLNKNTEAIQKIKEAISLSPQPLFYHNLGMIYDSLNDEENSSSNFLKALSISDNYPNAYLAHYNLGIYYKQKGEFEKALNHYTESLKLNPNFQDSRWNRSLILLQLGNLSHGFNDFDSRFLKSSPTDSRTFKSPVWLGESLKDKTLLVLTEQGAGDTIQFIRYLPLIKKENTKIILECKPELKELLSSITEIDKIITKEETSSTNYNYCIHLMSLPKIFQTTLETIPNKTPYLSAPQPLIDNFSNQLNTKELKVGICWEGNPLQEDNKTRSIPKEAFETLKDIPNVQIFSLQKGDSSFQLNNYAETAAIIQNLDLIISVDTSIAHLAGALNKPVWTLLSKIPDWRYLLERNDSPWYPSAKLFRQKESGDWFSVLKEVKIALQNLQRESP